MVLLRYYILQCSCLILLHLFCIDLKRSSSDPGKQFISIWNCNCLKQKWKQCLYLEQPSLRRKSSNLGPFLPKGSSGTINMSPAKVYWSNLQESSVNIICSQRVTPDSPSAPDRTGQAAPEQTLHTTAGATELVIHCSLSKLFNGSFCELFPLHCRTLSWFFFDSKCWMTANFCKMTRLEFSSQLEKIFRLFKLLFLVRIFN